MIQIILILMFREPRLKSFQRIAAEASVIAQYARRAENLLVRLPGFFLPAVVFHFQVQPIKQENHCAEWFAYPWSRTASLT